MKKWLGRDIKDLRLSLKLSRKDFAQILNVSAPTIEKWEHQDALNKPIRDKYIHILQQLSQRIKDNPLASLGLKAMTLAQPLSMTSLLGHTLNLSTFLKDENLDKSIKLLNQLKELAPEERKKFIKILTDVMND